MKGQSLRGLARPCRPNLDGRYRPMTMSLIRHGTHRAGFKGWLTENNVPGQEEPSIADDTHPDPTWEKTHHRSHMRRVERHQQKKAIAVKMRDPRLRKALTGSTSKMPRITQKTKPKAITAAEEADFEEELKAYKEGIFSAPGWVRQAIKGGEHMSQVKPEKLVRAQTKAPDRNINTPSSSSSKWETPISDTQAAIISDYLAHGARSPDFLR